MNFAASCLRRLRFCSKSVVLSLATAICLLHVAAPVAAQDSSTDVSPSGSPAQLPQTQSDIPYVDQGLQSPRSGAYGASSTQSTGNLGQDSSQGNQDRLLQRDQTLERRRMLPPDKPTEFQRLVTTSVGVTLPIFGSTLFRDVPSTFAPGENTPVTADYPIGPGDELRIQVYGQVNRRGLYLVDRSGDITFPEVGAIHVAGVPYSELQSFLTTRFSRVYRNFQLNVNLGHLRSIQVFVVGAARLPGAYTISSLSTLLNALFASGGPLPQGSLRDIQVQRGGKVVTHFDLYDVLLHGDKQGDIRLEPEDVIYIPPVGPQVAVSGSVNNPAIYEIHPGDTISRVLALAGGKTSLALGSQVQVTQIYQHSMRNVVEVDLAQSDPALANGDIVTVRAILDRYRDAVTLRGNVSFPGRYVWQPGMRVKDLVPTPDQLITSEYYERRNALGAPQKPPPPKQTYIRDRYGNLINTRNCATPSGSTSVTADGTTPTIPVTPKMTDCGPIGVVAGSNNPPTATGATESVDADEVAQPGPGAVMEPANAASGRVATETGSSATQGGNSLGSALTRSNGVFRPQNKLVLSAPDIDWSYAVIERLNSNTLKTVLIPFNPGLLYKQNDQDQNLPLEPGDVVTFFSTADINVPSVQQTRLVRLEGEFVSSGIYSVEPGETLRHLIGRAGGFTPDAYLYGSEFTRESTRRVQQQRLSEYADTLEEQVSAFLSASTSRAISPADAAAATAAATETRASIARLRQSVPSGRIVLEVKPDSRTIDSLPDIPLEDGDRFVIPRVPSTVAVEGRVYSANAFVYQHGRKERDYVRQAGGPDRNSDRKRQFILRADGSVYSAQYGNVNKALIFPGDTIVVPPQINHSSLLRGLLDFSSIAGQFGLAAAAVNVLK